jgi:hypothetical protein
MTPAEHLHADLVRAQWGSLRELALHERLARERRRDELIERFVDGLLVAAVVGVPLAVWLA